MNNDNIAKYQPMDLQHESDRGAVLIVASVIEDALEKLISMKLIKFEAKGKNKDKLFNDGNAPIGTFSAKIELSFRLGLITDKQKNMFNIFRRIRNDFAHSFANISLETSSINDSLMATFNSNPQLHDQVISAFKDDERLDEDFVKGYFTPRRIFEILYDMEIHRLYSKMELIVRVETLPSLDKQSNP